MRPSVSLSRYALLALLLSAPLARAADAPAPPAGEGDGPSLTVYSSADPAGFDPTRFIAQQRLGNNPQFAWQVPGFGVVRETRTVDVNAGRNEVKFTGVAEFIDPTTVSFADLTTPATAVLEQSFRFDLASPDKILERYVGETVAHETQKDGVTVGRVEGRVLSVNQGTVVLDVQGGGLRFLTTRDPGLRLPSLPEGLLTRPTLVWLLETAQGGSHKVRTSYQTSGLTWRADYNLVLDAADAKADVSAWVTLLNVSGAGWKDIRLKLVAGDVQRIQAGRGDAGMRRMAKSAEGGSSGFEEKAFFEYHLYTLPRRTDVLANATQQITLFPSAQEVAVEKVLVYYGLPEAAHWGFTPSPRTDRDIRSGANPKVDVYVRLKNAKENRMGMPLPRGKVRVYKRDDADGTLEFVGEDLIDHTAKDETVQVKLGQAFDVVGERVQTDFKVDTSRQTMTDSYRIALRNHKDVAVKVIVRENLFRWTNWEMVETSDPFVKVDARTVHFEVEVPPNGEKVVTYTARYTW
jgi:hypothetical protein